VWDRIVLEERTWSLNRTSNVKMSQNTPTDHRQTSLPSAPYTMSEARLQESHPPAVKSGTAEQSSTSDQVSQYEKPNLLSQRNDFLLDWTLKILRLATAVLFGVWAPISVSLTAER